MAVLEAQDDQADSESRRAFIYKKVSDAMLRTEETFPKRYDWGRDSEEASKLDAAMGAYIEGKARVEQVGEAWRAYLKSLKVTDTCYLCRGVIDSEGYCAACRVTTTHLEGSSETEE